MFGCCDGPGLISSAGGSYNLVDSRAGPTVLAVGAGGVVRTFYSSSSIFTLLFLPVFGRRLDID